MRAVKGGFSVHVVETTEGRTLFGEYAAGRRVNLERALRARIGWAATIVRVTWTASRWCSGSSGVGDAWLYDLRVPEAVRQCHSARRHYRDGVSLTVTSCRGWTSCRSRDPVHA